MAGEIILEPGRTFHEFSLLPGHATRNAIPKNISLDTFLSDDLSLRIPLLSAAMSSVTDFQMCFHLGKEGGMGVLPARLPIDYQTDIVRKIKQHEMNFVTPKKVFSRDSIGKTLETVKRFGHTRIPVTDEDNIFLGMFDLDHYLSSTGLNMNDPVTEAMIAFEKGNSVAPTTPYVNEVEISVEDAQHNLKKHRSRYLVILDQQDRLKGLAFTKDFEDIKIASAISTYKGWEERVEANIDAGVDLIVIDTSDAHSDFVGDVIREYKSRKYNVPLCAGNIVTYEGAKFLMNAGADIVKIGMSAGSICTTQREKATGRAPMTALMEADRARYDHLEGSEKYVPLIIDGGVSSPADMIIALTIADSVMMGGYFNHLFEAAGEKLDRDYQLIENALEQERDIAFVATWGEGSERAQNLERYGHGSPRHFFPEGEEGVVEYRGRLKPKVKTDLMKVRAALSNAGCEDLEQYRNEAVIELISPSSSEIVSTTHNMAERK
jgi:IMP dehydrogenase